MHFAGLNELTSHQHVRTATGPVAVIIAEDEVELAATIRHHVACGFKTVFLFAQKNLNVAPEMAELVHRVDYPTMNLDATVEIVNALNRALPPKTWFYYCYNAEFLFYPFSETRTVGELLSFHTEERRFSMLTYVIDMYAGNFDQADNGVSVEHALLDKSGYYSLARQGADGPKDRQLDFYGGLRWRFEEHIEAKRRRIDRISLVRSDRSITFRSDHTWSKEELNTYACPWHNNLTAAVASFKAAKALSTNPASRQHIDAFKWHNSVEFEWKSQQLLDLGLMEPGQWF